jgi:hypothetical protein
MKLVPIILSALGLMASSCSITPESLDGMIVTKPNGGRMKIEIGEGANGRGNDIRFFDETFILEPNNDTTIEWRRIYN